MASLGHSESTQLVSSRGNSRKCWLNLESILMDWKFSVEIDWFSPVRTSKKHQNYSCPWLLYAEYHNINCVHGRIRSTRVLTCNSWYYSQGRRITYIISCALLQFETTKKQYNVSNAIPWDFNTGLETQFRLFELPYKLKIWYGYILIFFRFQLISDQNWCLYAKFRRIPSNGHVWNESNVINSLSTKRHGQNGWHFTGDIFKCNFANEKAILITKIHSNMFLWI